MLAAGAPAGADVKRAEDLHITMNVLQVPRKRSVRDLVERLERIEYPSFPIKLVGVDSFYRIPRKGQDTHVVWLRPDGDSSWAIRALHARIVMGLRPLGYNVGQLALTPHMTVLNYPFRAAAEPLENFIKDNNRLRLPSWQCDRFYLYRSMMRDNPRHPLNNNGVGSKYEILGSFPLLKS